jgi:hypothetical protein
LFWRVDLDVVAASAADDPESPVAPAKPDPHWSLSCAQPGHMKTIMDHDGSARKTLAPTLRLKDVRTAEFLQEQAGRRCGRPLAEQAKFGIHWQRSRHRLP